MKNTPLPPIIWGTVIWGFILGEIIKILIIKVKVGMCDKEIKAIVVDCQEKFCKSRYGRDLVYYQAVVELEIDGEMRKSKSFSKRFYSYEIGEKISIKYSENKPKLCYDMGYTFINNTRGRYYINPFNTVLAWGSLVGFGLFTLCVFLVCLFTY